MTTNLSRAAPVSPSSVMVSVPWAPAYGPVPPVTAIDGRLIGTPNVARDEVDRDALGLWPVVVDTWQGFVFVHLDPNPVPLETWLGGQHDGPLGFAASPSASSASGIAP